MTFQELVEVSGTILTTFTLGMGVVFALSNYLGKIWADRLMQNERTAHEKALASHKAELERGLDDFRAKEERELASLRTELEQDSQRFIEHFKVELDVAKQKHMQGFQDKLAIYRQGSAMLSDALADLDLMTFNVKLPDAAIRYDKFNRQRLKVYADLAMIAPQSVMDAYDDLIDYVLVVTQAKQAYVWQTVRAKALKLLNEMRIDVGLGEATISYNGTL